MWTSVNIRAVMASAVLNCPGTDWRPPSCPTPRKTGAYFAFGLTGRPGSLLHLSSWTCFVTLCGGHCVAVGRILLSITNPCSGQVMAERPTPLLQPHSSPASLWFFSCGSLIILLGVLVV